MPKYSFSCQNPECGLSFDRMLKMAEHLTHVCPSCQETAPRVFDGQGFAFAFQTPPAKEGNSGVHKDDHPTADHAVGRSATRRWALYRERAKVKDAAREGGGTHKLARVDGPGYTEYETLTAPRAEARKALVPKALTALRVAKTPGKLLVPLTRDEAWPPGSGPRSRSHHTAPLRG